MKKLFILVTLFFSLLCTTLSFAKPSLTPANPRIGAKSYVILDYKSNRILTEKNADNVVSPASLTKMMTVYIIDQALANGSITLDTEVPISKTAWRTQGSRMFVEVDSQVKVRDLLRGIIIQSGNDASVAMAEYIAGSQAGFAQLMNQEAERLGMSNTHFVNPTGLPHKQHYSTARDMAILARALIHDFPESYALYSQKWFTYNDIKQPNRNRLLWRDKTVDGIKTGHTDEAGFCLVASAKRKDMRLITVVMGAKDDNARTSQSAQLLTHGFRFYDSKKLYAQNEIISEPRIWMGAEKQLPIGMVDDLYIALSRNQYKDLKIQMQLDQQIQAPITEKTEVGELVVKLGDQELTRKPLVALKTIEQGGFWNKLTDYVAFKVQSFRQRDENTEEAAT